ncbi:MAG TPA: hypothetical protein VIL20_11075 [Sandaracinaceae bacterium]
MTHAAEPFEGASLGGHRLDYGATEVDDPIDLRSAHERGPQSRRAGAGSGSDIGLQALLVALVLLIVVLAGALVVGIVGALMDAGEPADEPAVVAPR